MQLREPPFSIKTEELYSGLATDAQGLMPDEAARRLEAHGPNVLTEGHK